MRERPTRERPGADTVGRVRRIDSGSSPDRLLRSPRLEERSPRAAITPVPRRPPAARRPGAPSGPPRRVLRQAGPSTATVAPRRPAPAPAARRQAPPWTGTVTGTAAAGTRRVPAGARPGGTTTAAPARASRRRRAGDEGVEANARLTGTTAAVLLVLFAAEGVTVLQIGSLVTPHVFIGMLLVPPILLKMGSTIWRFSRYYLGSPAYRRKGPPPPLLRLLGPLVIVLTVGLFASGIALLLGPVGWRSPMLFLHKATFVLWLMAMAVHVLAHLLDTARLAPRDYVRYTRHQVRGASRRQWVVAASLAVGLVLAVAVVPKVGPWLAAGYVGHY